MSDARKLASALRRAADGTRRGEYNNLGDPDRFRVWAALAQSAADEIDTLRGELAEDRLAELLRELPGYKQALELLRAARCPNTECVDGAIPVPLGEHHVTHDMAIDAGDPSLEGQSMGIEWGQEQCQWCTERDELLGRKQGDPA